MSIDIRNAANVRLIQTALLAIIAGILGAMLYIQFDDMDKRDKRHARVSAEIRQVACDIVSVKNEVEGLRRDIDSLGYHALSKDDPDSLGSKVDSIFIILRRRYIDNTLK